MYEERPESFGEVVGLMQQMQECGQPPAELIQELAPDLKFGKCFFSIAYHTFHQLKDAQLDYLLYIRAQWHAGSQRG